MKDGAFTKYTKQKDPKKELSAKADKKFLKRC